MFELRDELFDYAAAGNLDFNHPAYGVLRSTVNGYIRFGHRITLWHGIFLGIFIDKKDRPQRRSFEQVWARSTKPLDAETKKQLEQYRLRMERIAFRHFLISAPECLLLLPFVLVWLVALTMWKFGVSVASTQQQTLGAWDGFRIRFSEIDNAAFLYGEPVTA